MTSPHGPTTPDGLDARDEGRLGLVLRTVADEARPAVVPADLWRRGQRQHRRRMAAALAVTVLILAIVVSLPTLVTRTWTAPPAQPRPAVPAIVPAPMWWQPGAQDAAPGPASLVVTGNGSFTSNDAFDGFEDDGMVVSTAGFTRTVKYNTGSNLQGELMLSPDGRYLAGDSSMRGSDPKVADTPRGWTSVLDLTTGAVRSYDAGIPVAWSPDGHLLTSFETFNLLDLDTGTARTIGPAAERGPCPTHYYCQLKPAAAFSPDGRSLAVVSGSSVYVVDVASGQSRPLVDLPEKSALDGPGAWNRDGLLLLWTVTPCRNDCGGDPVPTFTATYVDTRTGAFTRGPRFDPVSADAARVLGWQPDGSIVVHLLHSAIIPMVPTSEPERSELVALHPAGGRTTLIQLPDGAADVDVPRQLIEQGAFGGPSPSTVARIADMLSGHPVGLAIFAALGLCLLPVVRFVRRRPRLTPLSRPLP
jgi:hypothetical protein